MPRAFNVIRRDGLPAGSGQSIKWDVLDPITGDRFPPKAVLAVAKELADDPSPSGGGGWPTNDVLERLGFRTALKPGREQSEEADDLRSIVESNTETTTQQQLINARLGQGGYREALIELYGGKCVVTGLAVKEALRASHVKPWRASSDRERLDARNGLLLAATVDALFDRYLLTFTDDGRLLVCSSVNDAALTLIGITPNVRIDLSRETRTYMRWHRAEFEKFAGRARPY